MAGRFREPTDLVIAKGRKHLTKEEIVERKSREINVPYTEVKPPKYLDKKQKRTFKDIANKLKDINIYTELDADCLARYIIAQELYIVYTQKIAEYMQKGDLIMIKDLTSMQDKAFKQAQSCARDLGLTITSRCKIVVPTVEKEEVKENKFKKFEKTN